jgi:glutathione S-transferase
MEHFVDRIPAMVDCTGRHEPKRMFESGTMILYLCQGYDAEYKISYSFDSDQSVYFDILDLFFLN